MNDNDKSNKRRGKTVVIGVAVPVEMLADIDELAEREMRPRSVMLLYAMREYIARAKGELK